MTDRIIASGDARLIPPKGASRTSSRPCTDGAVPVISGDTETLLDALREARDVLYESHISARSVIALLDKIDLADVVAAGSCHQADYDLVHPIELLLALLRDDTSAEADKISDLMAQLSHPQGVGQ